MFESEPFSHNKVMSQARFDDIMQAIQYTNVDLSTKYIGHFHQIWQMQDIWTNQMDKECEQWISCLDKLMLKCLIKWCPSWVCIPEKPDLFGNEYHSIAGIGDRALVMWMVELLEGKD